MASAAPLGALFRAGERLFVVLAVLVLTGGPLPLMRAQADTAYDPMRGDPLMQLVLGLLYATTLLLVLLRWKRFLALLSRDWLLVLLVALALLSVAWSGAPEVTARRSVALLGTTCFGAYLVLRFRPPELLRLLAVAFGVAALLSLFFALALPGYEVTAEIPDDDSWHGIYVHKNILGRVMALGAAVCLLAALGRRRRRGPLLCAAALCAGLLGLSGSVTSMVILGAILLLLPIFRTLRWRPAAAVPVLCLAVLLAASGVMWSAGHLDFMLGALGRDVTLTGRTLLWAAVVDNILQRPWLGFGYSSFWLGWQGPSFAVWLATRWNATHAHNGFLDLWLDLGTLGFTLFLAGFAASFIHAGRWLRRTRGAHALWPIAFLTFMLLYNLSESAILRENSIFWALYVAAVLMVRAGSIAGLGSFQHRGHRG